MVRIPVNDWIEKTLSLSYATQRCVTIILLTWLGQGYIDYCLLYVQLIKAIALLKFHVPT